MFFPFKEIYLIITILVLVCKVSNLMVMEPLSELYQSKYVGFLRKTKRETLLHRRNEKNSLIVSYCLLSDKIIKKLAVFLL